jgi:hypothetical protein
MKRTVNFFFVFVFFCERARDEGGVFKNDNHARAEGVRASFFRA